MPFFLAMKSVMLAKPGKRPCDRCAGKGCFHCGRLGFDAMCPTCSNDHPLLLDTSKAGVTACQKCGISFLDDGSPVSAESSGS